MATKINLHFHGDFHAITSAHNLLAALIDSHLFHGNELDLDPAAAGIDVVVSGHSHRPKIETVGGVLYLNPGSAGPRRFTLPIAFATLELTRDALRPCIHEVGKVPHQP